MKTLFGRQGRGWLMLAAGILLLSLPLLGLAAEKTDGEIGMVLAKNLYCDVRGLAEGNVGLFFGLILTTMGLWNLINDGSIPGAITLMITGALLTSIPTLLESTFRGVGDLLYETKMSTTPFQPPNCSGFLSQDGSEFNSAMDDAKRAVENESYRQKMRAAGHQDFYSPF